MMKRIFSILILTAVAVSMSAQDYIFNRQPLVETDYAELPIGAIKPEGWLYDQLLRQKDGFTGHLD